MINVTICEDLGGVSENIRVELARGRLSARHMQRALKISRTRWERRMRDPQGWTLGELCAVAGELRISVDHLLRETR